MANVHIILLLLCFSLALQVAVLRGQDFCVANPASPAGLTGSACKDPTKVTADDFAFSSALAVPGNTSANAFKASFALASVNEMPGLNGLGVSMGRADIAPGGGFPMHSHTHTELILVLEGTLEAGFISTANVVYSKTLTKGDVFAIPPGLLHWARNPANVPSWGVVVFSSPSLMVQLMTSALFGNNLPTEVVQATTFLDEGQITKLKDVFGGTN